MQHTVCSIRSLTTNLDTLLIIASVGLTCVIKFEIVGAALICRYLSQISFVLFQATADSDVAQKLVQLTYLFTSFLFALCF